MLLYSFNEAILLMDKEIFMFFLTEWGVYDEKFKQTPGLLKEG